MSNSPNPPKPSAANTPPGPLAAAFFEAARPKSKVVTVYGLEIEVRQPTIGQLTELTEGSEASNIDIGMTQIIKYCFVPGTDEPVFKETDLERLKASAASNEMTLLQREITGFFDLDVAAAAEDLSETQPEEISSR